MTIGTNYLNAVIALNQPGRVGSSSIYTAAVADNMIARSQATVAHDLHGRRVTPAVIIDINPNRCGDI